MADGHPFVRPPVEASLFGIHDGPAHFTVRGTHKEDTPLVGKDPHSSLIGLYCQPTVHHRVHPHKGKSRYLNYFPALLEDRCMNFSH